LRVQLESNDQDNIRQLMTRADRLFALHGNKQGGTIAVVENPDTQMRELLSTHSREAASVGLIAGGSSLKNDFQVIQGHRLAGDSYTSMWRPLVLLAC
jgi:hypothetical protein